MSQLPSNPAEMKMLPGSGEIVAKAQSDTGSVAPSRQLAEIPKDELEHLAVFLGQVLQLILGNLRQLPGRRNAPCVALCFRDNLPAAGQHLHFSGIGG